MAANNQSVTQLNGILVSYHLDIRMSNVSIVRFDLRQISNYRKPQQKRIHETTGKLYQPLTVQQNYPDNDSIAQRI